MQATFRKPVFTAILLTLLPASALAQTPIRVMTWNVQAVAAPGSAEYGATRDVIMRLGPDVIGINEVSSSADIGNLSALASDAGYPYVVVPSTTPFGGVRNAILSRLPILASAIETSASLSGDPGANDITRDVVVATVDVPGNAIDTTVAVMHWKSGGDNDDELRRALESIRVVQSVDALDPLTEAVIVIGDVNEELDSVPRSPSVFTSLTSGLPASFQLGADLAQILASPGVSNDPFTYLVAAQLVPLDALQLDGSDATRPASGRRLDYFFASPALLGTTAQTEVYDAADEGLPGGLLKYGVAPPSSSTANASDHLPVVADFLVPAAGGPPPPPPPPPPSAGAVWINELHYDNAGADTDEAIEIAGVENTDLSGWSLVFYNGNGGTVYDTVSLAGTIPSHTSGFGFVTVLVPGIQNGSPDAVALVDDAGAVVELLSYEGVLVAADGPAAGMTSIDLGVEESPSALAGTSLQRIGHGSTAADFAFAPSTTATFGSVNVDQSLVCTTCPPNVWINELHYDNAGADAGEGVEIAGTAGLDLSGWHLVAYNGNGGAAYDTVALTGVIPLQQHGLGAVFVPIAGLQNGSPDAVALVDDTGAVIELLSWEGAMTAADGPAAGMVSTDIGVSEDGATPDGWSLQREGVGPGAPAFTWAAAAPSTYGAMNVNQVFSP